MKQNLLHYRLRWLSTAVCLLAILILLGVSISLSLSTRAQVVDPGKVGTPIITPTPIYQPEPGIIIYDPPGSKRCGEDGRVCFNYRVPKIKYNGTIVSGTVSISLQLYRDGQPVGPPLNSGPFTQDGRYCYSAERMVSVGYRDFDWRATVTFSMPQGPVRQTTIGTLPDGNFEGLNNDFTLYCDEGEQEHEEDEPGNPGDPGDPGGACCMGTNLVQNGNFSNTVPPLSFSSDYRNVSPPIFDTTKGFNPGEFIVGDSSAASARCKQWNVNGHTNCGAPRDMFMMVNGRTGQSGPGPVVIWEQDVAVRAGSYDFCAWFKDLKQCCFNVRPRITLEARINFGVTLITKVINTRADQPCGWQRISTRINNVPKGILKLRILLDETRSGDGNDVAIDDISLTASSACAQ